MLNGTAATGLLHPRIFNGVAVNSEELRKKWWRRLKSPEADTEPAFFMLRVNVQRETAPSPSSVIGIQ